MATRFQSLPLKTPGVVGVSLRGATGRDCRRLLGRLAERCLESGQVRVVLDLSGLEALGGGAAGVLADMQRRLVEAGGEAVFAGALPTVRHFLSRRFGDLPLRCYETVAEAEAGLRDGIPPAPSGSGGDDGGDDGGDGGSGGGGSGRTSRRRAAATPAARASARSGTAAKAGNGEAAGQECEAGAVCLALDAVEPDGSLDLMLADFADAEAAEGAVDGQKTTAEAPTEAPGDVVGHADSGLPDHGADMAAGAGEAAAAGPDRRPGRHRRFLALEEAAVQLRAAFATPAQASRLLSDLLHSHGLAAEASFWLRRDGALVDGEGRELPARGALSTTLAETARPLTLLDVAEIDLDEAEAELLADLQPDLLLPILDRSELRGVVLLFHGREGGEYGVTETFALELLMHSLVRWWDRDRAVSGAPAAGAVPAVAAGSEPAAAPDLGAPSEAGSAAAGGASGGPFQRAVLRHLLGLLQRGHPEAEAQADRIAVLTEGLALRLGLPAAQAEEIVTGALLRDVGLLAEPDLDLALSRQFSPAQWERYRAHPTRGADLLAGLGASPLVLEVVRHHHERFNGEGQPAALAGRDIPLPARIVAVAETYVTMTTDLPSRPALPSGRALAILTENLDGRHDPLVLGALVRVVEAGGDGDDPA